MNTEEHTALRLRDEGTALPGFVVNQSNVWRTIRRRRAIRAVRGGTGVVAVAVISGVVVQGSWSTEPTVTLEVADSPSSSPSSPSAVAPEVPDEIALGAAAESVGQGASLSGTLAPEPGCVYIQSEEGWTALPVFPHDVVRWDGTTLQLRGREYRAGDPITVGGGFRLTSMFEPDEIAVHIPDGCRTDEIFAVG